MYTNSCYIGDAMRHDITRQHKLSNGKFNNNNNVADINNNSNNNNNSPPDAWTEPKPAVHMTILYIYNVECYV